MAVMSLAKRLNLGTFSTDKKISGEIVEGQLPTPPYVSAADASNGSVAVTLVKSSTSALRCPSGGPRTDA